MTTGQTIILTGARSRAKAMTLVEIAPDGAVFNVREATRNADQNAKMWAMLSDVSRAKPEDRHHTPDVWKALFMHALGHEVAFEQALDGRGPFPVGFRSSRLSKTQMADLITLISEYGDRHGVEWTG
jgi:hypothetical protein